LPRLLAGRLAAAKLGTVAETDCFVLAADTVVAVGRRVLGKPATAQEARAFLALLSGRRHRVLTSVMLRAPDGRRAQRVAESIVTFARLDAVQMESYLACDEWHGKAGGYAIQGRAAVFVRFLSGSYSNVVGLPLFETSQLLNGLGYRPP
jgi:septum formation protein